MKTIRRGAEAQIIELAAAFADALLAGDESAAEITLREAIDAGLGSAGDR